MLTTLKNAFKIKEIRNKIFFTFVMLIVIRIGSSLPVPGIDRTYFASWFEQQTGDIFSILDAFTGGSFLQMSILALNITPYITSSIIMQLLTIAIPKLEEMQRDGEDGRKKIASITRYVTVALALLQASALAIGFGGQGLLQEYNFLNVITVIGHGISIVLVINIISRMPQDLTGLYNTFVQPQIAKGAFASAVLAAVIILAIIIGMVVLVIILNDGIRKIPVQYAKKIQGRKMVGGQSTNIPLKVNTSGVIPIIFASSIMQFPIIISSLAGYKGTGAWAKVLAVLNSGNWCRFTKESWYYSIGLLIYIVLVVFFAYFYTSVTFNPLEIANNMKKQGGFIPGIRPGKPTSDYLTRILNYIIFIGACGLTIVGILPFIFQGVFNANISFGGTSLIIIVSVILETMKQVESQMLVRNYKGFLND